LWTIWKKPARQIQGLGSFQVKRWAQAALDLASHSFARASGTAVAALMGATPKFIARDPAVSDVFSDLCWLLDGFAEQLQESNR